MLNSHTHVNLVPSLATSSLLETNRITSNQLSVNLNFVKIVGSCPLFRSVGWLYYLCPAQCLTSYPFTRLRNPTVIISGVHGPAMRRHACGRVTRRQDRERTGRSVDHYFALQHTPGFTDVGWSPCVGIPLGWSVLLGLSVGRAMSVLPIIISHNFRKIIPYKGLVNNLQS
jgi:hypothetical protein